MSIVILCILAALRYPGDALAERRAEDKRSAPAVPYEKTGAARDKL